MKLILERRNDKWYIDCGRCTREWTLDTQRWCFECWGPGWGDIDTKFDHTIFIFPQLMQANWFMLKFA